MSLSSTTRSVTVTPRFHCPARGVMSGHRNRKGTCAENSYGNPLSHIFAR